MQSANKKNTPRNYNEAMSPEALYTPPSYNEAMYTPPSYNQALHTHPTYNKALYTYPNNDNPPKPTTSTSSPTTVFYQSDEPVSSFTHNFLSLL